jgi:hypothetical protein
VVHSFIIASFPKIIINAPINRPPWGTTNLTKSTILNSRTLWRPCKIPKGANRYRQVIDVFTKRVMQNRYHIDTCDVHPEIRVFAGANEKVYIIANNLEYFGFDRPLGQIVSHYAVRALQNLDHRSAADAVRVAAVMLHPDFQGACASFLRGTKDSRAKCDQSVDPDIAWAMQALVLFQDPSFLVPWPDCMRQEDVEGVDPQRTRRQACLWSP